ncbi:MAG: hypothetical protein R3325_15530 [Thermoanaerobaculia bacterium]|nr:hypothetical protein [Thermoanaerobaculia bacterium]
MSRRRCIWSHVLDERVREVRVVVRDRFGRNPGERSFWVLPEHEAEFRDFCEHGLRYGPRFFGLLVLSLVVLLAGAALAVTGSTRLGLTLAGGSMVFQGLLIWRYPFSTPETVQMLGVARSIRVVRALGIVNIVMGFLVMALDRLLPRV